MSVPAYPEYKDSGVQWLGAVPGHWEGKPLFAVAKELDERNYGMQETNLLSLSYGKIKRKNIEDNDGLLPASFETYQIVERDDIVWRLTDLQNDQRSLRTGIVRERGIITSAYLATRPVAVEPEFLSYLLRAYDLTKVFYSMGGGLRQGMKFSDVKWLPVMLPSATEQTVIAAFLDRETTKIDALVAEQERLIALLKEKRQAVISHAVTKGLNPHAPMKDSGIEWLGEIPAHWEVDRISRMFGKIGSGTTPNTDAAFEEGSVNWVTTGELREAPISMTKKQVNQEALANLSALQVYSPGTLLIAMYGATIGRLGWLDEPACTNQACCAMADPIKVEIRFAYYGLGAATEALILLSSGGGQPNINQEKIRAFRLPIPPPSEQAVIIAFLDEEASKIDMLMDQARAAITLLQERRAALISAAVTGKIDVRGLVDAPSEMEAA